MKIITNHLWCTGATIAALLHMVKVVNHTYCGALYCYYMYGTHYLLRQFQTQWSLP